MKFSPNKLRSIRLAKGITLKEAAEAAGYKHASSILYAERGLVRLPIDRLLALAELYGVTIEDFCDPTPDERAG